jgi:hypothetical protein
MLSVELNKMSRKTPSQDSNFDDFKKIWEEMDQIEPLTPITFREEG